VRFIVGVSFGQTFEYTAIAVVEKIGEIQEVRHLERHRGQTYPLLVDRLRTIVNDLPGVATLVVDSTGVGPPVVELIERDRIQADIFPITVTAGDTVTQDGPSRRIPRRDLASTVAVLLQTGRLRIAQNLGLSRVLDQELRCFRAGVSTAGRDALEHWRERDHDDLVLTVSVAAWMGERGQDPLLAYYDMLLEGDGRPFR
jgi:hypothetical protein